MNIINYTDFKNICRICMSNCDITFNKNSIMLDVFHKLTDVQFEINNELPQQICLKCFDFMNEIHAFSMTCKQTHSVLMKCLNDFKKKRVNEELKIIEEINIKDEITIEEHKIALDNDWVINEEMEIKDKVTTEEHKIEFVNIKVENDWETNDVLNKDVTERTNDLSKIHPENEKDHISAYPSVSEITNNKRRLSYKCDQCEKSFIQSSDLLRHKRVHSGEKPYKCDQCGKSFAESWNLIRHKRVHSGKKPYKCDQCEKSFAESGTLTKHKRMHSGERPYQCDQCEKSFAASGTLTKHKRVHSVVRPYKCDYCENTFNRLDHLKSHKRLHNHNM